MTQVALNTLDYAKRLIEAGLDAKIAETQAQMQVEILKNMLSKQDIDSGRLATTQDLFALEQRLTEKFMRHIDTASSDRQVIRGEINKHAQTNTADHQSIRNEMAEGFTATAKDHQAIRDEMRQGFAAAAADRQAIRDEMRQNFATNAADHQAIRDEMKEGFKDAALDRAKIRNELKNIEFRILSILGSMMIAGFTILGIVMHLPH